MHGLLHQSASFDASQAVQQGLFVQAAYAMDNSGSGGLTPTPVPLPAPFEFIAWIQMQDASLFGRGEESKTWKFYGFVGQNSTDKNDFILAIRGVDGDKEIVNALSSIIAVPWSWRGAVGKNFLDLYKTLRIVEYHTGRMDVAENQGGECFAAQLKSLINRRNAQQSSIPTRRIPSDGRVRVVGHSLGAALATLYVADNQAKIEVGSSHVEPYSLCTFASPRVGNGIFASAFNRLGLTSWRVANPLDIVTNLPPWLPIFEFTHIGELTALDARTIKFGIACEHSLSTYLGLLDPGQRIDPTCLAGAPLGSASEP